MKLVPALLAFVVLILPQVAAAQIGQIIPTDCYCTGKAPGLGCVLQTIQNLLNVGIAIGVVIATIVIAYAGMLWVLNPFHAENKKLGRTMLMNAVIGLVIALGAWIFVDFLMKSVYNPQASGTGVAQFGPWNEILGEGPKCIEPTQVQPSQPSQPSQPTQPTQPTQPGEPEPTPAGPFPFGISGINGQQRNHASTQLQQMLTCMAQQPGTSGAVITSISDDYLFQGKTWADCRGGQCQHCGTGSGNVCPAGGASYHYGGTTCGNASYAVDFSANAGTAQSTALIQAAQQCGGRSVGEGGNHTHIQIGSCN